MKATAKKGPDTHARTKTKGEETIHIHNENITLKVKFLMIMSPGHIKSSSLFNPCCLKVGW